MRHLRELGLVELLRERVAQRTPLLGICLGMQLLFERSDELGETDGLGLIPATSADCGPAACASRTSAGARSGSSVHRR